MTDPMTSSEEELKDALELAEYYAGPNDALNKAPHVEVCEDAATMASALLRLSSDLAAAQKDAESEGQLRESVAARMMAYLERAEKAEADLSASHQREQQMRRALEEIQRLHVHHMMIPAQDSSGKRYCPECGALKVLDALGKDASDG